MMRVMMLAAVVALAGCQTTTAPMATNAPVAAVSVPSGNMTAMLNTARAQQGRGPLREDARLSRAARAHAQDMVANGYFSHTGANGSDLSDRARAAGYGCVAAENIAWGQKSEADVMTAWMNSPGHRRNILLGDVVDFGIGSADTHWVMLLGRGC